MMNPVEAATAPFISSALFWCWWCSRSLPTYVSTTRKRSKNVQPRSTAHTAMILNTLETRTKSGSLEEQVHVYSPPPEVAELLNEV